MLDAVDPGIKVQPVVIGPFVATYTPSTGLVTFPEASATYLINTGCLVVDNTNNKAYPIVQVNSTNSFTIAQNISPQPNFNNATIIPAQSLFRNHIGSCFYTETFSIGCYAIGEQTNLWRLQSLLMFIFLRYKNIFFENRGLRRATMTLGRFEQMQTEGMNGQIIFARYFNFRCFVKHYWPTVISPMLTGVAVYDLKVIGGGMTSPGYLKQAQQQGWEMEDDPNAPFFPGG